MAAFIEDLLAVGKPVASQNPSGTQAISVITQTRQRVLAHGEDAVVRDVLQQVQQLSPQACKVRTGLLASLNVWDQLVLLINVMLYAGNHHVPALHVGRWGRTALILQQLISGTAALLAGQHAHSSCRR